MQNVNDWSSSKMTLKTINLKKSMYKDNRVCFGRSYKNLKLNKLKFW